MNPQDVGHLLGRRFHTLRRRTFFVRTVKNKLMSTPILQGMKLSVPTNTDIYCRVGDHPEKLMCDTGKDTTIWTYPCGGAWVKDDQDDKFSTFQCTGR